MVLVEGEGDRAAILAVVGTMGKDFEAGGIAVIPCMGKQNLDRPALIFRDLGIPVYVVWDADKGKQDAKSATNRALTRIMAGQPEDYPSGVGDSYAVFEVDLETTLREELGPERYNRITAEVAEQLGLSGEARRKNPVAVRALIERAYAEGASAPTIEQIVTRIAAARVASELSPAEAVAA